MPFYEVGEGETGIVYIFRIYFDGKRVLEQVLRINVCVIRCMSPMGKGIFVRSLKSEERHAQAASHHGARPCDRI